MLYEFPLQESHDISNKVPDTEKNDVFQSDIVDYDADIDQALTTRKGLTGMEIVLMSVCGSVVMIVIIAGIKFKCVTSKKKKFPFTGRATWYKSFGPSTSDSVDFGMRKMETTNLNAYPTRVYPTLAPSPAFGRTTAV